MKDKKYHALSFTFIVITAVLIIATSPHPNFTVIDNRVTFEFSDDYLLIKINTIDNPNYYIMEDSVQLNFVGRSEYQVLINFTNENGKIIGRNVSVNYPRESESVEYDVPVFETFVEDSYFIIKIRNELIRFENIDRAYIDMFNQSIDSSSRRYKEIYR